MECLICCETKDLVIKKDCTCKYCFECLLKALKYNGVEHCLGCLQTIHLEEIFNFTKYEPEYQEILLFKLIQKQNDVLPCPKQNCNYYGIIPKNCTNNLQCPKCQTTWCVQSNYISQSTTLTKITEFIFTKKCPNCQVKIQKNGGCPMMKCQHCRYHYCWDCDQDSYSHQEKLCTFQKSFKFFLFFSEILTILYYVQLLYFFLLISQIVFQFALICLISPTLLILPIGFIYLIIQKRKLIAFSIIILEYLIYQIKIYIELDYDTIFSIILIELIVIIIYVFKKYKK